MNPRHLTWLVTACLLILGGRVLPATADPHPSATVLRDLVFQADDFSESLASGMTIQPEGMTPDSTSGKGEYASEPLQAPIPFNALVPQWKANLPSETGVLLQIRTGDNKLELGKWVDIYPSPDWTLPEDEVVVGEMLVVPEQDKTHEYFQFRILLTAQEPGDEPLLRELRLTFIDSSAGPSVEEMIREQEAIDRTNRQLAASEEDGYPKPFVISREVWCTNPACDYTEGLEYQPVTHLILHHTVSGGGGDSAATVRAIWAYHTYTRGWGDIGYNFLVDSGGVIFEGHLGGDDVVGTHAAGANAGSMGLAMIGTYSSIEPAQPMVESIVDMFSWKADQRNIDVFDASDTLPGIEWGLPHVMGHRDVSGTTECPGDAAHTLIPAIRDEVARRIGLESRHLYVDELSAGFTKSNANWYVGPLQCGHNTHSWYTYSTTDPAQAANWGEWRPEVPEYGRYRIEVYAPYCNTGRAETAGARYTVEHAGGVSNVVVDQNDRIGLWTSIGEYDLPAGSGTVVRLSDLTTSDSGLGMWFDAIRLLPLEALPSAVPSSPAYAGWVSERTVTFTWQIINPENVKATALQVAADDDFQDLVLNVNWPTTVLSHTAQFDQDYAALYWRVVVTSQSNNEYPSAVSRFGLDSEPPTSAVAKIYWLELNGFYQMFWQGQDALSGVDKYDIDYRPAGGGDGDWKPWLSGSRATRGFFAPPDPAKVYEFRSQATDLLGNQEALKNTADISSDLAINLDHGVLLPLIGRQ